VSQQTFASSCLSVPSKKVGIYHSSGKRHVHSSPTANIVTKASNYFQSESISAADAQLPVASIREAFLEKETDGILEIAQELLEVFSPKDLIRASISAACGNKGQAASIINSFVGSCALIENPNPSVALSLLDSFYELSDEIGLFPDIITYCAAYKALRLGGNEFDQTAESVLESAERLAKKAGGSKRRRALASARRKAGSSNSLVTNVEDELQKLYGQEIGVLYQDDDVLVLSKPSSMVCFHKRKTTAGKVRKKRQGNQENQKTIDISLVDAVMDLGIPLSTLNPDASGIVHRIDRGTSGCIVLAKNNDAHARLVTAFFTRKVKKEYIALVPAIASDIGGNHDDLPERGSVNLPVDGRPASSSYEIMARFGKSALQLKVGTFTGRKHQVREHLAKGLKRPIFLDPLYSKTEFSTEPKPLLEAVSSGSQRFFLHASTLLIPELGIDVNAPLPSWWVEAVGGLE